VIATKSSTGVGEWMSPIKCRMFEVQIRRGRRRERGIQTF
jgi:hypothetical protein